MPAPRKYPPTTLVVGAGSTMSIQVGAPAEDTTATLLVRLKQEIVHAKSIRVDCDASSPSRPANPGDSKNCSDFGTYAEAKRWFDTYYPYYGDIARLDQDGDLVPCASLPGAPK